MQVNPCSAWIHIFKFWKQLLDNCSEQLFLEETEKIMVNETIIPIATGGLGCNWYSYLPSATFYSRLLTLSWYAR
jgi:hypothetical protein